MEEASKKHTLAINCPNCGKKAELLQLTRKIPHFGEILFSTISCTSCGLKLSDVINTESNEPCRFKARIESEKDLETKIVKSSSGTVKIEELGVEILPGAFSEGYFTNIEGLLERVEAANSVVLHSKEISEENRKNALSLVEKIKKAKEGRLSFTVEIEDAFGNSALIGKKAEKLKLSEEQKKQIAERFRP